MQYFLEELTKETILEVLKKKKVLGFDILKRYHEYEKKIYAFVNQAVSSPYYNREILNSLIDLYEWFSAYQKFRDNYFSNLLVKLDEKNETLFVPDNSQFSPNPELPDRYLLLRRLDENQGQVCNFGDFHISDLPNLTNYYKFNEAYLEKFIDQIESLKKNIKTWVNITNNELIIDFIKSFRIKKTDGEWL